MHAFREEMKRKKKKKEWSIGAATEETDLLVFKLNSTRLNRPTSIRVDSVSRKISLIYVGDYVAYAFFLGVIDSKRIHERTVRLCEAERWRSCLFERRLIFIDDKLIAIRKEL